MGAIVSQANEHLRASLALASNIQVSSLEAIATTGFLSHSSLGQLISLKRQRLRKAHEKLIEFLKADGIHYIPATTGPFILARLPGNLSLRAEERKAVEQLILAGVVVRCTLTSFAKSPATSKSTSTCSRASRISILDMEYGPAQVVCLLRRRFGLLWLIVLWSMITVSYPAKKSQGKYIMGWPLCQMGRGLLNLGSGLPT